MSCVQTCHNYKGHNYGGRNYIGHNYVGTAYIGYSHTGHTYLGHNFIGHCWCKSQYPVCRHVGVRTRLLRTFLGVCVCVDVSTGICTHICMEIYVAKAISRYQRPETSQRSCLSSSGLCTHGLYSYGLHSDGLGSHFPCSHGQCSYDMGPLG